jgi:Cytochrome c554 and c-prime
VQRARSLWGIITARGLLACVLLAGCCLLVRHSLLAQSQAPVELSEITEYHVLTQDWWPTTGTPPRETYAGSNACQQCHAEEASTASLTPMAHASYRSAVGAWGVKPTVATTRIGPYLYRDVVEGDDPKLIVTAGNQARSADITWTFGAGVVGQTFVLENKSKWYDAELTSFRGLRGGMDISPAHKPPKAGDLDNALGEYLPPKTAARCFGCHTTTATTKDQFDPQHAIPGVTCEACHGPGLAHVVAANMNLSQDAGSLIFNPRSLNPVESVDFCGACHTTSADVAEQKLFVPSNVRFPPYRLEKSMCWGVRGDERLVCFSCHNPHKPLVQEASFYDNRCLTCHNAQSNQSPNRSEAAAKVCPKARANCTNCHMPKYYVPEMHAKFTDHFIRIVRDGEPYPVR